MALLTVTVSQLNRYLKAVFEEDPKLSDLYIAGEISNFTRHYRSGHLYFSLKDADSTAKAVMFRSDAEELRFEPESGMSVLVRCSVRVYERDGVYQLYVRDMQPRGAGAMAVAFAQIKDRLEREGLFDASRKRPLPPYPARVGVVTSETGAALQDIRRILERRYPLCTLVLCVAQVQGQGAAQELRRALEHLDRHGRCDVIILGRGGGSAEDLWAFNDEALARAVAACDTPVISAVGHETDYTICDFTADVRASTPSAAAELAVPDREELERYLESCKDYLSRRANEMLEQRWQRLDALSQSRALRSAGHWVEKRKERLDFLSHLLYNNKRIIIQDRTQLLAQRAALLDSLSPLRVLERGYCAAFVGDKPVCAAEELREKDALRVRFRDGCAHCSVQRVELEEQGEADKEL